MKAEEAWGARLENCAHPLSHQFMSIACEKESLVVLAADMPTVEEIVQIVEDVGDHVCALKTHVDMVEDFNLEDWGAVVDAARSKGMLLFEDRKFADIGRVAKTQMGGLYDIRVWSDLVTSHSVSGPDVVDGIAEAWDEVERVGGVLLLAQMSSSGNLLEDSYTDKTLEMGTASPHVIGYIGNGSNPSELGDLRSKVGEGKMIWTPGVNLSSQEGVLGQRYGNPSEAVRAHNCGFWNTRSHGPTGCSERICIGLLGCPSGEVGWTMRSSRPGAAIQSSFWEWDLTSSLRY